MQICVLSWAESNLRGRFLRSINNLAESQRNPYLGHNSTQTPQDCPITPPPSPKTSMLIPLSKWCFAGTTKAFLVKIKDICLLLKGSRLLVLLSINYQFIISLSCLIILSLSSKVIYTHLIKAIGCISYCNANIKMFMFVTLFHICQYDIKKGLNVTLTAY